MKRFLSRLVFLLAPVFLVCSSAGVAVSADPVLIGLDAEFGHATSTSAQAIRQGILIAIAEINRAGGVLGGRKLELVERDNRSVPARAAQNIRELAKMPGLVAVFCGKFSPVAVEMLPIVHEIGMPFLDPWAAVDAIVDNGYNPNFVFRLSLKDSWAITTMLKYAEKRKLLKVGMLVPRTSWGRSNVEAAEKYISKQKTIKIVETQWYNWGDKTLAEKYSSFINSGAQVIILVANEGEGSVLVKEIADLPQNERIPVISHWGITGGNFVQIAGDALFRVDLSVVQTYSFIGKKDARTEKVLSGARTLFDIKRAEDIISPVGLAHAYDLTHILALAVQKAGSTDRKAVRKALEEVRNYDGLIKFYKQPFTRERHEALSPEDLFMAKFERDGTLVRIR